jgi:hypothetical protein
VTVNESMPVGTTVPMIKDNELRLIKMRRRLEDLFRSLDLVQDEVTVAAEAARSHGIPDIANVLSLAICNRLSNQLRVLTHIIEQLGGITELSDEDAEVGNQSTPGP